MNRKVYSSILALFTCLTLSFLTACGGGSSHSGGGGGTTTTYTVSVAASPASVTVNGTVSVTATTNDTAGVNWTASCASGASSCGSFSPATSLTGVAVTYTAPANADTVTITGTSITNSAVSGTATVTVTAAAATNQTYVYYLSGEEANGSYYAVAGAVTLDAAGDIIAGEQDYNDGVGNTSPGEPNTPDTITPATGALVVDPTTGLGTLSMTSSNTNAGDGGIELFDIQFVNANHALIVQADGSATGSGSFDLQTATAPTGNFAFAVSGVNPSTDSVAYGGVFTSTTGSATGTIDINDSDGGVSTTNAFTATTATPDAFGRSVVTGISDLAYTSAAPINFVSYPVGPEAMRIIDVDTTDSAVGSAFGQGSATFTNTSLANGVFTLLGQWSEAYGTLGQFTTDGNGNISGTADDNELYNSIEAENVPLTGSTYDLTGSTNGYGNVSLSFGTSAVDVSSLGLYMTDPTLNLNDPNNTTTDLGGALIADMDADLPGGIGVITPQTDTTAADFTGSYAAGFQDFNSFVSGCDGCEFDMVGPFTMTGGLLSTASIGADTSDPVNTLTGLETTGDIYTSTPLAVSAGYFSMSSANSTPNPLTATFNTGATPAPSLTFNVDIYQASATTLYWINWDTGSVFLGPIEAQSTATAFPGSGSKKPKTQAKRK
jgi:hypothetical protein